MGSSAQRAMGTMRLPWETHYNMRSPEGASAFPDVVPRRLVSGVSACVSGSGQGRDRKPERQASADIPKTQGKTWPKLSWPRSAREQRSTPNKLSSKMTQLFTRKWYGAEWDTDLNERTSQLFLASVPTKLKST
jgi:hypothetical protein